MDEPTSSPLGKVRESAELKRPDAAPVDDSLLDSDPLVGRIERGADGRILGGVRLRRKLGSGDTGSIYQGTQLSLGATVAIKVIGADFAADDPAAIERFEARARASRR